MSPTITVHLLHDKTLTDDNREKFIQIANRYGQILKFYNVEELCAEKFAEIINYFPKAKESLFSIAMFYRLFIPHLLLPQGIEKVFYLDSDIIVNLDISEFWQIDLGDKPFGAVSRASQVKDKANDNTSKVMALVREGIVNADDYFFSGGLLMNLKVMREKENAILAGMKFISERSQYIYLDQDVLNYCFSTSYVKLPVNFNRVMLFERAESKWAVEKKIYHYAANRITLGMDMNDPYNRLWMDYFIKTPWVDDETKAVLSGNTLPSRKNYAVSVVIPMYNMEEFVGECLDSLLIQTFQDFEVIVVDDCSTDNSYAIVEEYAPKFNGRLRIEKTEKNSEGGGYVPRNIGMMLARGEYIQFLDADDMLLPTALEILYLAATIYDAEVVYTSSIYYWNAPNDIYLHKDGISRKMGNTQRDLTVDDPKKNLSRLLLEPGEGNFRGSWTKFVQRDFLIKNKIFFSNLSNAGDFIWVINVYCHSKRLLRISTPLYFYRRFNNNSILRTVRSPQEQCNYWFSSFVNYAKHLYELEKKNEVLSENHDYCLSALKLQFLWCLNRTEDARKELGNKEIYKILHSEFAKTSSDSVKSLSPFFFSFIDNESKKIPDGYAEMIRKFSQHFTAKIFIRRTDKKTEPENLQFLYVSDNNARISKPEGWQKSGVCHMIDSYAGKLEIVAKADVEGQVQIRLAGRWVQNPENKSKRLPYWIDYTKLVVNGKTVFDKITPAWHDKPYNYNLDVKAGEEIKIQVEWLPHRDDRDDLLQKVAPPQEPQKVQENNAEKLRESETLISELRTALDNEKKLHNKDVELISKFKDYFTARADIQLVTKQKGDFQIISVSDEKAEIRKPAWFQKNGIGYQIQSYAGRLEFIAKSSVDGKINLRLRGLDVRTPEDKTKRIPYWINYTRLIVDEEVIFDEITPAWLEKFYSYNADIKAGEEIKIQIEWLPHGNN